MHKDFRKKLSNKQIDWLKRNGIEYQKDEIAGWYFSIGERYILPIRATDTNVYLMEEDHSEDGDGAVQVGMFDSLKDALKALLRSKGE